MALNFGLLDTSIPERIGAMPANALAMRRQRIMQDEQIAGQREQQQMQNALAQMQMRKAQGEMEQEQAYRNALSQAPAGDWNAVLPEIRRVAPDRAMALEKQLGEMQKGKAETRAKMSDVAHKKLGMYREALVNVNSPQQFAQWLTAQHSDPDLQELMGALPSLEDSLATIPQDPREFEQMKVKSAVGIGKFMEMNKPSDFERTMDVAGLTPEQRQAAARQRLTKETTHAPAAITNVNMTQEREESKAVGKGFGEQYNEIQKSGLDAGGKIARFDRMEQLLTGVSTGKLTPATTQISALADSVGIKIDPNLPAKQAAEALANEVSLQLRNPSGGAGMPGAMSDKDREFLVGMTPGLAKTPEGNKLIIETARKMAQRDRDVARIAREYRKKNGTLDEGFYDELSQFSEKNPLFKGPSQAATVPRLPSVGSVQGGYRFRGGNPADPKSWERVQ